MVDLALVRASEFISSPLISFAKELRSEFWALHACCSVCIAISLYADMDNR